MRATAINAMTFNADAFSAADAYDMDELQEMLDGSSIDELQGDDAADALAKLDYPQGETARVFKAVNADGETYLFSIF